MRGLKEFLTTHAFGNADWRDLAAQLEAASRRDLGRWSDRWLLAPSMPRVRIEWTSDAEGVVLEGVAIEPPSLNSLFLKLTGRGLRD